MTKLKSSVPVSGQLPYRLTNDYLFRALLQKNNTAVKGLVCAFLNLPPDEVVSCTIQNPIILGDAIDEKACILDVLLLLNGSRYLNLEMQIEHMSMWPDRSLYYLCRTFSNLKPGQDYHDVIPCMQISILSHSPFPDIHEFYSRYRLINPANQHIFSGKFALNMLDLSQINHVSEEEKNSDLYTWARLFLASDWEEVQTLTEHSAVLESAAATLKELTADEKIQWQCLARERYAHDIASYRRDGFEEGIAQGISQGIAEGEDRSNKLTLALLSAERYDDLKRAATDKEYQYQLFKEFGI